MQFTLMFALFLRIFQISCVKYSIVKTNNEMIHYDEPDIKSEDGTKKLIVQDEFHVFDEDLLQIVHKTPTFLMEKNYALHKLEAGAFVNQEITRTIVITNTKVSKIPKGAFKNLKIFELVLRDNDIVTIEAEAFSDLSNLEIVDLARNKIAEFNEKAFVNSPAKFLDLAFNELKAIKDDQFGFMSEKVPGKILLDNNRIEKVSKKGFNSVLLHTLNLESNKIAELPEEVFQNQKLVSVFLQANLLKTMPGSFFKNKELKFGDLRENKLECDAQKKLKKLAQDNAATVLFADNC